MNIFKIFSLRICYFAPNVNIFVFIRFDKNPKPDRTNSIPTDREQQWGRRKEEIDGILSKVQALL